MFMQVWEDFKTKFVHRVATFVPDWGDNYKLNHVDRTPGLGMKAVEPPAWAEKFCELNDTTLRDFALSQFQRNKSSSEMIWESHASRS
jgi:hypothetical protein